MDLHPKQLVRVNVAQIQVEGITHLHGRNCSTHLHGRFGHQIQFHERLGHDNYPGRFSHGRLVHVAMLSYGRMKHLLAKAEGCERAVNRNFCVDPRTITLERLRHLVARALHLREEFSMLILRSDNSTPLTLEGDWDLEGALSEDNRIELVLRLHPKEPGLEEWDIICPGDVPVAGHEASDPSPHQATRKGSFLDQVFQRSNSVLSEPEFLSVCDWPCPLRHATYRAGGADHALRPALWMHLLDVYPAGATPIEREEFLNRKAEEYYGLRHSWQKLVQAGTIPTSLRDVTCLVRKDVRRTDRHLPDQPDERVLYNVLTTFAAHHPSLGYCQGMSDLLSPLLHVMRTEARAYVAFCALMRRMRDNFRRDGRSMRTKFAHLRRAIRAQDPQLHAHLHRVGATDLLFCYRWLLLDLKREFPYHEMLTLTEVLWSTLRPLESEGGVQLYEERFPSPTDHESIKERVDPKDLLTFTDDHFGGQKGSTTPRSLKRWAQLSRRQSIAQNVESCSSSDDDDEGDVSTRHRRPRRRRHSVSNSWSGRDSSAEIGPGRERYSCTVHEMQINGWLDEANPPRIRLGSSDSNYGSNFSDEELTVSDDEQHQQTMSRSEGYTSGNSRTVTDSEEEDECSSSFDSVDTYFNDSCCDLLPPPTRFGDGKPFLMFVCLSMILNHRDAILAQEMDANEIGIYFDRLVRKHRLSEVLPRAKELFFEYLRSGWTDDD